MSVIAVKTPCGEYKMFFAKFDYFYLIDMEWKLSNN